MEQLIAFPDLLIFCLEKNIDYTLVKLMDLGPQVTWNKKI